jgi:hypothetical protein
MLIIIVQKMRKDGTPLEKGNENLLLHVCICLENLLLKIVSKYQWRSHTFVLGGGRSERRRRETI